MDASQRWLVLDDMAARIAPISIRHPLRVAVDGRTAAGKTILSDELAASVSSRGRPVIRASIDSFHRPKSERYACGRYSAEGYYYDARDLSAIVNLLLIPLGPQGNRLYRTASFDLEKDQPIAQEPLLAPNDAVLIVDGTFLQRAELRDCWDLTIFVKTSPEIAEQRALGRDAGTLGGVEATRKLYANRYHAAFELYENFCAPEELADAVFDNENPERPTLVVRDGCLLALV